MGYLFRLALREDTHTPEADAIAGVRAWSYDAAEPSTLELVVPAGAFSALRRPARRRIAHAMRAEGAHPQTRVLVLTREQYRAREEAASGSRQ